MYKVILDDLFIFAQLHYLHFSYQVLVAFKNGPFLYLKYVSFTLVLKSLIIPVSIF